jgi:hypothetical protein
VEEPAGDQGRPPAHLESLDRDLGIVTSFPKGVWALDKDFERHD